MAASLSPETCGIEESPEEAALSGFNDTRADYPHDKLVHELFEEQVERAPEITAVVYGTRSLSYAELNRQANRLARYLLSQGVTADQPVGICCERSPEMIVGLLAIFKAGGAYLPLDPSYPSERLHYMLQDGDPKVVLTQHALRGALPNTTANVVTLEAALADVSSYSGENVLTTDLGLNSRNLVYVIYTSGSTGRPKGTAMPHYAMVNLIEWHRRTFGVGAGQAVLQFAALSFDVAFQEIFTTLCLGDTLVLLDEWVRHDLRALDAVLRSRNIARLFVPPLMLQSLADYFASARDVPNAMRDVITAGEQLRIDRRITELFRQLPGCRLHNHYGPTETHVVTSLTLPADPDRWPALPPIGRPIANARLYVLDERGAALPIGATGEIYIGGAGVARGYWQRPELTAQRFVPDPFDVEPSGRLYRTGDLGRWRADGVLEYLGRNDDQVKIRGYRIELGEIEVQLARHELVREAAVVAREDAPGEKRLVGYVTVRGQARLKTDELRAHLEAALPEHLVPGAFVILDRFPLTPTGKLDRRALPPPAVAQPSEGYESPRGQVEELLTGIWCDLLHVERVGRRDNFFELGGDSFLIVQLMERLRRAGFAADVRLVFENPTPAALARVLRGSCADEAVGPVNLIPTPCETLTPSMLTLVSLEQEDLDRIVKAVPGGAHNIQDIYPLAPLQEGMLFHHLLERDAGDTYVVSALLTVSSRLRADELVIALHALLDRHDVLRTLVLWDGLPQPIQVVCRTAILPVELLTLNPAEEGLAQMREYMRPERQRMDLGLAPLMRLRIAAEPSGPQWHVLLQLHHLICDHESLEALFHELAVCLDGRVGELAPAGPYRNHVAHALEQGRARDPQAFFRSKLADVDKSTAPFGLADVRADATRISQAGQDLDAGLAKRIRTHARRAKVSAATLFHAAWALVVARTCGRDDVVFGTLLLGRLQSASGAQRILGMFMNTLPLRLSLQHVTVRDLIPRIQQELAQLLDHEQASLALAQQCSRLGGAAPLFTSLLNYRHSSHSAADGARVLADGVRLIDVMEWTNYPITLSVDDLGEAFALTAKTDRRIEPQRLLAYVTTALQSLVTALDHTPDTPVLELSIQPPAERREVLESFNATWTPCSVDKLVHEIFSEQARRVPAAVALVCGDRTMTYAELDRCTDQLATYLRGKGVGPDRLVGLCVERSLEMVIGLLGILKAGGAYVPIDPAYPVERMAFMLQDSRPVLLLTQAGLRARLPTFVGDVLALDEDWRLVTDRPSARIDSRPGGLAPDHLAYVIYTSGSTGKPKGVTVEHRNVVSLWHSLQRIYRQSPPCENVAVNASFTFDSSVKQFVQLLSGRTLVLIEEDDRRDAIRLLDLIERQDVHAIDCTPSQLNTWITAGLLARQASPLRLVLVGGEAIEPQLWNALAGHSGVDFYNVYGPTECTVDATFARLNGDPTGPHIGRPMDNTRVYLVDEHGQPVPVGVAGEICIGGNGVARGYLNQPELTARRFVADQFAAEPTARLYRTGDLARWRGNGIIEYVGRNDHQVKVRGFRVELEEIEAQLARHPRVDRAIVSLREDAPGEQRLVAYIKRRGDESLTGEQLRASLRSTLPDYMIPRAFVMLAEFPLTPNAKIDRQALPAPDQADYTSSEYVAPQGEIEQMVAELWRKLLHVGRVGRHDDFFDLGGHSLLAMQVIVQIHSLLSIRLSVASLFEYRSLKDLAAHVERVRHAQVLDTIAAGADDVDDILEDVAAMSEAEVQRLVQELQRGPE